MLKRSISGAVFVAVIVGFFFLREVDVRLFDILIYFFSLVGTFEVWRALKGDKEGFGIAFSGTAGNVATAIVFIGALAFVPVFTFAGFGWAVAALCFCAAAVVATGLCHEENAALAAGSGLLAVLYPDALLLAMLAANVHGQYALLALLLIFVTSPLADTFAYLVGSTVGGKKLCPKISPNKTVSGAVGGLVGGAIGALVLYFIFTPDLGIGCEWLIFLVIGIAAAFFTEAGDLFESWIKRKAGIKDMGKIMPGHGGIMDRIDGILFCSLFIALVFLFI